MKFFSSTIQWVLSVLAGVMLFIPLSLCAQSDKALKLNLKSENAPLPLGEFRVSLDSQVLTRKNQGTDNFEVSPSFFPSQVSFGSPESRGLEKNHFIDELSRNNFMLRLSDSSKLPQPTRLHKSVHRKLSSTLTLSVSYLEEHQRYGVTRARALGAQKRLGRWALYGEIGRKEEETFHKEIKTVVPPVITPLAMANIQTDQPQLPALRTNSSPSAQNSNSPDSLPALNNYYLEAIYNFRPSFKGKVSYQRSLIDTLDRNEDLQVEGIVEAGKDVVIKAGYRNQTTPEKTKNAAPPNDTKVWTEFILKF